NKRNDRISQTPSRNKKNKVEAQLRKVNKTNRVVKPICDVDVKHSLSNANSEIRCATCNKSMFDGVHDKCLLDLVQNGNNRRTFTIVGNSCPLTRITLTNVVSSKQTTSYSAEIQKPEIKVYSRKPKNFKNIGSSKIAKIVEYNNANHSEPNQIWGSTATEIPSSPSLDMTGCPDSTLVLLDSGMTRLQGLWGMVTISWEMLLSLGVDLLSESRDTNLYIISLDDKLKSSSICLLSKASKTKSWLWHCRLSHLNFGTLNKLAKDGLAQGIPRLKFQKDYLCSACALGKDNGTEFVNQTLCEFYETVGISHQTSVARTPQQNGVVERRNRTLVEATRTMLIFLKFHYFSGPKLSIQLVIPKTVL
ncbi:retrovirus-related pol polyprotein from transposon TNT 1-94, partial [Tanacetum coccineum]